MTRREFFQRFVFPPLVSAGMIGVVYIGARIGWAQLDGALRSHYATVYVIEVEVEKPVCRYGGETLAGFGSEDYEPCCGKDDLT